jgi:3-oxoacyl-[acyl-carrier protein] reductase
MVQKQTAVVAGASGAIGEAVSRTLLQSNYRVIACSRNPNLLREQILSFDSDLREPQIEVCALDVSSPESTKAGTRTLLALAGEIDVFVNCIGVATGATFLLTSSKSLIENMEINFLGPILLTQSIARQMVKRRGGSIIHLGSTAGMNGDPGTTAYGASKAALMYATKVMARELGGFGVRVNAIAPSVVNSPMSEVMDHSHKKSLIESGPIRREVEPSEVAEVVRFLAGSSSAMITGQVIRVDGGQKGI